MGQTNKKMKQRADASSGQCQGPQWQWGVIYSRPILAFVLAVTAPHRDRTCGTVEYPAGCWLCWLLLVPCTPETVYGPLFVKMETADFSSVIAAERCFMGQGQQGTAKVAQNRVGNYLTLRDLRRQAITISVVTPVLCLFHSAEAKLKTMFQNLRAQTN